MTFTSWEHTSFVLRHAAVMDRDGDFDVRDVAVEHGRAAAVGRSLPVGLGRSVDLSGTWLMPGIFDCHAHVAMTSTVTAELLNQPISRWAIEAGRNCAQLLNAGVTFVRDAGGADAGLRDAIVEGVIPGPQLQVSIVLISQTGGHADGFLPGPGLELTGQYLVPDYPGRPPAVVDGPEGMRHAVRQVLRAGGDWVKLCTTGGVLSPHDDPRTAELTLDEIGIAVFEARRRGKAVMAHANGGEGIDLAIQAGVRSIEHGCFLEERQAVAMAKAGCWLVPTLSVIQDVVRLSEAGQIPSYAIAKAQSLGSVFGDSVRVAREHGVSIASGSDFLKREQHGRNLEEIALLHDAGLTMSEALLAATARSAQLCGVSDQLGSLAPGLRFDAIVLDRDPTNPDTFRSPEAITGVFKGGRPVKEHPRLPTDVPITA